MAFRTPSPSRNGPTIPPNTPVWHKTAINQFSTETKKMDKIYAEVALETKHHFAVGMEPDKFLEKFLPWNETTRKEYRTTPIPDSRLADLSSVPPRPGEVESVMYEPYVAALDNWVTSDMLKNTSVQGPQTLRFQHTPKPDTSCGKLNPDICTYWEKDLSDSTNFARLQTYEEFKSHIGHDPFQHKSDEGPIDRRKKALDKDKCKKEEENKEEKNNIKMDDTLFIDELREEEPIAQDNGETTGDSKDGPERDTEAGNHTRGQIAVYAAVALSMAFRKHLFSVLILGQYARFILWDRRGAIVTRRFDYTKEPSSSSSFIFDFYLRYGQLNLLQRGFDETAERCPIPEDVSKAFMDYQQSSWYGGSKFGREDGSRSFEDFFKITVSDPHTESEVFYVPPPKYSSASVFPFCRATRRSLACTIEEDGKAHMCFLKESWQEYSPRTGHEADIYRKLKKAGVENVASMRLGGNVKGLDTITQQWFTKPSFGSQCPKGKMVCHRVVLDTIARDLSTFTWCKVLLACIADAVEAAKQAYAAGILHRDISASNIMIVKREDTKEWKGILIDWDMCLLWLNAEGAPRVGRTGTWAFMSAQILGNPSGHTHTLWDEMESAFWVLVYQTLRYTGHSWSPNRICDAIQTIFNHNVHEPSGEKTGGFHKAAVISSCSIGNSQLHLPLFPNLDLNKLLNDLGKFFAPRYLTESEPRAYSGFEDYPHFIELLRTASKKMEPLSVTPRGLQSPTNDSNPPQHRILWKNATVTGSAGDYCLMQMSADPTMSNAVQKKQVTQLMSRQLHGMDGSYVSHSKRSHIGYPEDQEEGPSSKRRRR